MSAPSSPWLGEWHSADEAVQARVSRQGTPDPATCGALAIDGHTWLFRDWVWLLDPLGLDLSPGPHSPLDDELLIFAVDRRRAFLAQAGLQDLALPAGTTDAATGTEWLHLSLQFSATACGDDTPASAQAWLPADALPDWLARAGLHRRMRQDKAWADHLPAPLRWALQPLTLPAGLLRRLVAGCVVRLPLAARRDSFCGLQGTGLRLDLQPADDPATWIVTQGLQGHAIPPSFAVTGALMDPDDLDVPHDGDSTEVPDDDRASPDELHETADDVATEEAHDGIDAATGKALSLDDLGIPVTVLCGRVELPLHELRAWGPGSEVSLPTQALDEIELCSGSRVLARGRLIRLNDALAVRITGVMP